MSKTCKIIRIEYVGVKPTYNVEMKSSQHNYKIVDGNNYVFTANSHACAYSFLAYQTAWLKTYFPLEFMCALLSSVVSEQQKDKRIRYENLLPKMGIELLPYDINKSKDVYIIENNCLRRPLSIIKGIGDITLKNIINNQPYKDFENFLNKNKKNILNKNIFLSLVDSNAMSIWGPKDNLIEKYLLFNSNKNNKAYNKKINKDNTANLF